ncbi:MAG: adenine phosphoribosyltransferase [Deltaproteobacteria bacterium]|nr:adenine phosphoribosyltransferase [Deltaproteobacteria bacterium]
MEDLKKYIRDIPDFPKPGIVFKDITPLLQKKGGLEAVTRMFAERFAGFGIDKVVGIESRGFIFGAALSVALKVGFIPVRKAGKLPWTKVSEEYILEYGKDKLEMHADAVLPGEKVLVVDDLLATGGTANAVSLMLEKQKAIVAALAFVVELDFLKGREKLKGKEIFSLLHY